MKREILIIPILMALIIAGCTVKEPGTPKWEVEMTIPIADKTYGLADLIDDPTDSLTTDSLGNWVSVIGDSLLYINYGDTIVRTSNDDSLVVDSIHHELTNYVGYLTVLAPGTESTYYLLQEIDPSYQPGIYPFVVPFDIEPGPKNMNAYQEYDWILLHHVETGDTNEVTITLTNNFGFPIDNMLISLYGEQPNILLYEAFFAGLILPSESVSVTDTLPSGIEIDNEMIVGVSGHSPGSTTPVEITANDNIHIDVELSPLIVETALAHIPSQDFNTFEYFSIESEDQIVSAQIKFATIDYTITNQTGLYNRVTFVIPNFTDTLGEAFDTTFNLPPNEEFDASGVDLSGYTLETSNNNISAQVTATIFDSEDPTYYPQVMVPVDHDQFVRANFDVYDPGTADYSFSFSSFEAIMQMQTNEIEPTSMQVENIPEGLDSISVADAVLDLRLTSTLGINVPLELELSAYKEGVLEEVLNKSCVVPAGSKYNPQTTHVIFEDVEDIINVIPDELEIRGSYSVGGFISLNEENFNGAYIEGSYLLYSPFSVQVGQTFFEPEITTIDNGFENRLISADLTLRIESHMPLSGSAYIIACYDSTEFDNPNSTEVDTFFQVLLPTAELGPGGYVTAPGYLEEVQTLNTEQLDMFANASADNPLFIKTSVVINSTGGSAVNCGPNDYIKVGASGHFLVDVDLEEGGGL